MIFTKVLDSLYSLPNLLADQQVGGLKILLSLCCDFVSSFDGELIIKIVQVQYFAQVALVFFK